MSQLPYIEACLRETLRLTPTAPAFTVTPRSDLGKDHEKLARKYAVRKGQPIVAWLPQIHRDPAVYGDDADLFKPERMLDEPFSKLPPNSWKPFGNGMRGCIGRAFAWQEALLTTALLLQKFNFRFDDPSYQLQIKQTLTIKPKDFFMHATLRDPINLVYLEKTLHDPAPLGKHWKNDRNIDDSVSGKSKTPMSILYGSNAGTCEALAQNLARAATSRGYYAQVGSLDSAVDKVPKDRPVVLITSSMRFRYFKVPKWTTKS